MNKVQEAFSKIKLKDYEKQWILNTVLFGIYFFILKETLSGEAGLFSVIAVLVFMMWLTCTAVGLIYILYHLAKDWYEKIIYAEESQRGIVYKFFQWVASSDRD